MSPDEPGGAESWSAGLDGYERLTVLGRGGTATVYSASRSADGAPVAIKVFDAPEATSFGRQLRASERLGAATGVVATIDHGTLPDGRSYIVSPFASGGSLDDQMQRFGPMGPARVAALGAQLARSLDAAHSAGVLHRDLKPSNVLIDGDGTPLLADFGAASTSRPGAASETMTVTILYAAPEVLEGAPTTERSDVYSLGLTLLALTIGANPFGGSTESGLAPLVNRICADGVPDPEDHDVPTGLAAVLRRATALDPDQRYRDAGAFADALDAAGRDLDAVPVDAPPVGSRGRDGRSRRTWALAAAALLLAAVVVGGAVVLAGDEGRDEPAAAEATVPSTIGEPATRANGILGPLYEQSDRNFVGLLTDECGDGDRWAELSIHAGPDDTAAGVETPWEAVSGEGAGTFISWMPCDTQINEARFVLGATGRWFVFVAQLPQDQYDEVSATMRENETSPSPDYTVSEAVLETLTDPNVYEGWAKIDVED